MLRVELRLKLDSAAAVVVGRRSGSWASPPLRAAGVVATGGPFSQGAPNRQGGCVARPEAMRPSVAHGRPWREPFLAGCSQVGNSKNIVGQDIVKLLDIGTLELRPGLVALRLLGVVGSISAGAFVRDGRGYPA